MIMRKDALMLWRTWERLNRGSKELGPRNMATIGGPISKVEERLRSACRMLTLYYYMKRSYKAHSSIVSPSAAVGSSSSSPSSAFFANLSASSRICLGTS